MKKPILTLLCMAIFTSSVMIHAEEDIDILAEQTDELYRLGAGSQDGAYTSLGLSMIGWGIGIAAGIGILASFVSQSHSKKSSSSSTSSN